MAAAVIWLDESGGLHASVLETDELAEEWAEECAVKGLPVVMICDHEMPPGAELPGLPGALARMDTPGTPDQKWPGPV